MEVEEARAVRRFVSEAVDDTWGHGDERSGGRLNGFGVRAELEEHRAFDDVERVRVAAMNVGLRAELARLVARLGDRDRIECRLDAEASPVRVHDHLALVGA